jgi:predicted phage-related endonuclease
MRLWCAKQGIKSEGDAQEEDPGLSDALEFGHVMEPVLLGWYERKQGVTCTPGARTVHPAHPWLWATLDATAGTDRIVEAKMVGSPALYRHWDASSQDGVPNYVRAQVTIGMACHGAREAHVVASVGGRPPHVWTVMFDQELADLLIEGATSFWQSVNDGTPPPLDATDATRVYLRHKFPANVDRRILEMDDDVTNALASARMEYAETEKRATTEKRRLDAELMARVGPHDGIQGRWGRFTWSLNAKGVRVTRFTGARDE